MSGMFKHIEGETAILAMGGVYKECDVYERRGGELYARAFGGFVRLKYDGSTSKSSARLDTLTISPLWATKVGNLCWRSGADRRLLDSQLSYLPVAKEV